METREFQTHKFPVMMTPSMREQIERVAIDRGVSAAAYIREAIRLRLVEERLQERPAG